MADYHVGCGLFGIYAGLLSTKDKSMWAKKSEVTEEAIAAVRDYMVSEFIKGNQTTGGYSWTRKDGTKIELRITAKETGREE